MTRRPHLNVGIVGLTVSAFNYGIWNILLVTPIRARDTILDQSIPTFDIVQAIELAPTQLQLPAMEALAIIRRPSQDDYWYPKVHVETQHIPIKWNHASLKKRHVRIHRSPAGAHFHG